MQRCAPLRLCAESAQRDETEPRHGSARAEVRVWVKVRRSLDRGQVRLNRSKGRAGAAARIG